MPDDIMSVGYSVDTSGLTAGGQALDQFKKKNADAAASMKDLGAKTKDAGSASTLYAEGLKGIQSQLVALAGGLGPVGVALSSLGPSGLVVAAAFGSLSKAFNAVRDGAKEFRQYARDLKETADSSGLATDELQKLGQEALAHGTSWERASFGLNYFNMQRDQASRGEGALYDALRRVNPVLAQQFATATSTSQALNVFGQALASVDTKTQAFLGRAGLGRNQTSLAQTLADMSKGASDAVSKFGVTIDEQVIQKQTQAAIVAEQKAKATEVAWNQAYSAIYEKWRDFKKSIGLGDDGTISIRVALSITDVVSNLGKGPTAATLDDMIAKAQAELAAAKAGVTTPSVQTNRLFGTSGVGMGRGMMPSALGQTQDKQTSATETNTSAVDKLTAKLDELIAQRDKTILAGVAGAYEGLAASSASQGAASSPSDQDKINKQILGLTNEKQNLSLRQAILSVDDQVRLKMIDINLAGLQGKGITDQQRASVEAVFRAQANQAQLQEQIGYGLATNGALQKQNELDINSLLARRVISYDQISQVVDVLQKKNDATIKQMEVLQAKLPNLKQLQLDSGDLRMQLDKLGTDSLNNLTTALVDVGTGSKTAGQAFRDFGLAVAKSLEEMLIKMTIVVPLARALQQTLGAFLPGGGDIYGVNQGAVPVIGSSGVGVGSVITPVRHSGGLVNYSGQTRYVHPAYFENAPRYHGGGIIGPDEVPIVARRGEGVFTPEQMAAMGGGAVTNNIIIENHTGAEVTTQQSKNSSGGMDQRVILRAATSSDIANGHMDKAMRSRYGIVPVGQQR